MQTNKQQQTIKPLKPQTQHYCAMAILVFSQFAEDAIVELLNCPQLAHPQIKYDLVSVQDMLKRNKKKIRKLKPNAADDMEDFVCSIVDECDPILDYTRKNIMIEISPFVKFDLLQAAITLSLVDAFLQCSILVNQMINCRTSDFIEMRRRINLVEKHLGGYQLNEDQKINLTASTIAVNNLIAKIIKTIKDSL